MVFEYLFTLIYIYITLHYLNICLHCKNVAYLTILVLSILLCVCLSSETCGWFSWIFCILWWLFCFVFCNVNRKIVWCWKSLGLSCYWKGCWVVKGSCMEIALFSIDIFKKKERKKKSRSGSRLSFFQILGQVRTKECCGQQVLIAEIVFWSVMLMSHDGILLQVVGYCSSV